jgi:hypothetical protein
MTTTTLEITTTFEAAAETTKPKVEIETTTVPFIRGLDSSGVIQSLTTNLLVFAILISTNFLSHL